MEQYGPVIASIVAIVWWMIVPMVINYKLSKSLQLPGYVIILLTIIASWFITFVLIILLAVSKMMGKKVL